jgi:hypothetical protein
MKNIFVQIRSSLAGTIWRKRIFFSLIGALGGYAYYYYIGCASGACPISSNPYISTGYGAAIGLTLALGNRKKVQL